MCVHPTPYIVLRDDGEAECTLCGRKTSDYQDRSVQQQ